MAERSDAEFLQVGIVELGENRKVDVVLGKTLRVLPKAEFSSQSATCCIEAAPRIIGLNPPASARLPDKSSGQ